MEFRQLSYFEGVARAGSFSRAASILNVAQPALSRQVALLERELGARLLTRNGRGVVLTSAGAQFLPLVVGILRSVNDAKWLVAADSKVPTGAVRLGVPLSVSRILSPRFLELAQAQFPRVSLHVTEAWTGQIRQDLKDGKLDFGVISESQLDGSLVWRRLLTESVSLIKAPGVPTSSPLRLSDVPAIPLVLPRQPHGIRVLLDELCRQHGLSLNVVLESEVWAVITDVVAKGIACTLFPARELKREIASGALIAVPIRNPSIRNSLCLARLASSALPTYADAVFEALSSQLSNLIRTEGASPRAPRTKLGQRS